MIKVKRIKFLNKKIIMIRGNSKEIMKETTALLRKVYEAIEIKSGKEEADNFVDFAAFLAKKKEEEIQEREPEDVWEEFLNGR